jgi:hypothetical protein
MVKLEEAANDVWQSCCEKGRTDADFRYADAAICCRNKPFPEGSA